MFFFDQIIKLPENRSINNNVIKLVEDKQLLYISIYTSSLIKLETLKTNIEIYLKIGFI